MIKIKLFPQGLNMPTHHRRNFRHLFFDIAWFGVLNGSFITFSSVYLTRIGASPMQLGMFTAAPAIGALLFSLPFGHWLQSKQIDRTVFWSSVSYRLLYLLWIPLTILFAAKSQVTIALWATMLFSGPGTLLAIGFNALFADVVPPAWRSHVLGIRQGVLAVTSITATLICGAILERVFFPLNYQIVFGIGFLGAAMSTVHLWFIRSENKGLTYNKTAAPMNDQANPGFPAVSRESPPQTTMRFFAYRASVKRPKFEVLNGSYGRIIALVFFFFLALYTPNPIYNPYWIGQLGYGDQLISTGTAAFYIFQLIGSFQITRIAGHFGSRRTLALGAMLISAYPGITALSPHPTAFLLASAISGFAWGLVGGALLSFVLNVVPSGERPRYMAWYNLLTNLAILGGSILGPQLAALVGLRSALGIASFLRFSSGVFIWIFGQVPIGDHEGGKIGVVDPG